MRRSFAALLFTSLVAAAPALASEKFVLDPEHTTVLFYVNHVGFSDMIGKFTEVSGDLFLDFQNPKESSVDVHIKPASVETASKKLDEHLQDADWFNTAKYPDIHFVSTSVRTTSPRDAEVTGDLTLLGVTLPVVLRVHHTKADYIMVGNNFVAGFSADAVLTRSKFGMSKYVPMVGDDVRIHIEAEGISQQRKPGKATETR